MYPAIFYLGAVAIYGLSVVLMRRTSPFSRCGGSQYERKQTLRLFSDILVVTAVLLLIIGLFTQFSTWYP